MYVNISYFLPYVLVIGLEVFIFEVFVGIRTHCGIWLKIPSGRLPLTILLQHSLKNMLLLRDFFFG